MTSRAALVFATAAVIGACSPSPPVAMYGPAPIDPERAARMDAGTETTTTDAGAPDKAPGR